jgi:hypothetical protein
MLGDTMTGVVALGLAAHHLTRKQSQQRRSLEGWIVDPALSKPSGLDLPVWRHPHPRFVRQDDPVSAQPRR